MIKYISTSPSDSSDVLRTFKYPYMSCEVICCDVESILTTIVTTGDDQLIESLFSFLDPPGALDARLAGYFEKVGVHKGNQRGEINNSRTCVGDYHINGT